MLCSVRWPWPVFRLLRSPLRDACKDRATVAQQLLDERDEGLEHLTKTIRTRCTREITYIAQTGRFPLGTQLHAILVTMAINMRLDSGSLESLNSTIKSTMSLASNTRMSLELLSSRVNARKTLTLLSSGSSKLKDVRPILESLARSAMLHQGSEDEILGDTFRWTPPQPTNMTTNTPSVYDPSLSLTIQQKWAVRHHRRLMKCLRKANKDAATQKASDGHDVCDDDGKENIDKKFLICVGFHREGLPCVNKSDCDIYLVAELTGRTCQLLKLHHRASSSDALQVCFGRQADLSGNA